MSLKKEEKYRRKQWRREFGLYLASERLAHHMTVQEFSAWSGLSGICVERMEVGKADIWLHTLQLMADLYQKKLVIRFE